MKVKPKNKESVDFNLIEVGKCFRRSDEGAIYMKTRYQGNTSSVHIMSGEIYSISQDSRVLPCEIEATEK